MGYLIVVFIVMYLFIALMNKQIYFLNESIPIFNILYSEEIKDEYISNAEIVLYNNKNTFGMLIFKTNARGKLFSPLSKFNTNQHIFYNKEDEKVLSKRSEYEHYVVNENIIIKTSYSYLVENEDNPLKPIGKTIYVYSGILSQDNQLMNDQGLEIPVDFSKEINDKKYVFFLVTEEPIQLSHLLSSFVIEY